eukprot:UN02581
MSALRFLLSLSSARSATYDIRKMSSCSWSIYCSRVCSLARSSIYIVAADMAKRQAAAIVDFHFFSFVCCFDY